MSENIPKRDGDEWSQWMCLVSYSFAGLWFAGDALISEKAGQNIPLSIIGQEAYSQFNSLCLPLQQSPLPGEREKQNADGQNSQPITFKSNGKTEFIKRTHKPHNRKTDQSQTHTITTPSHEKTWFMKGHRVPE